MRYFLFLLICVPKMLYSQQVLNGKVLAENTPIENVIILNNKTKQNTLTNAKGEFVINASPNDILTIASPQIEGMQIQLYNYSFEKNPLVIQVELKSNLLEEVKVSGITTKSVGIPQPTKTFTQAERRLRTAGDFRWYSPLAIPLGGMSIDGLINKMSGRTAMLKKELQVERYQTYLKNLKEIFSTEFYTATLGLPPDYVDGFLVYASENRKVIEVLKSKNNEQLKFLLIELAVKYKEDNVGK